MSRYDCARCGVTYHAVGPDFEGHVCKDIAARLKRREAQKAAVVDVLRSHAGDIAGDLFDDAAEAIVTKLAGMGVDHD